MSPTEIALLATLRAPIVRLERVCEEYLGIGYERAKQLAALRLNDLLGRGSEAKGRLHAWIR